VTTSLILSDAEVSSTDKLPDCLLHLVLPTIAMGLVCNMVKITVIFEPDSGVQSTVGRLLHGHRHIATNQPTIFEFSPLELGQVEIFFG
jgi:hypothetical protein